MNKTTLIRSLQMAYDQMADDPGLECVDTLAVMQDAIEDGLEYFTGTRPPQIVSERDDSEPLDSIGE